MEKQVNKPKLRFPEFEGEWEIKKLAEVAEKRIVKNKDNKIKNVFTNSAVQGIVNQRDFFEKDIANQNNLLGYYIVEHNDFVYNPRISTYAPVGPISRNKLQSGIMSPLYSVFRFNIGNIDFVEHFFSTTKWHIHMGNIANYGARDDRMSFSVGDFYKMPIPLPNLEEQTKIASFLTAVDDKLQALKKKKTLLAQYKKGVMQKIFSQELRFKDDNGNEHPDWEERKLGEIAISHYQGINTASEKTNYYSNGYPILQAKHITSETITYYDAKYVSVEDFEKHKEKYNPKINEILISNIGTLGKIVLIEQDVKFLIAWNIFKVKLKENLSNPKYITYVLKNVASKGYFEEVQSGNATKFVNKTEMLGIPIFLPTIPEQTKIANFLSAIDDKTQAVEVQIEKMEVWKKGLLQQMFC